MTKQHHSAQQSKIWATKKLGDLRQQYPELQEILHGSSWSEKSMRLTVIPNQTFWDPWLRKRCLNRAYVNHLTKLSWNSKTKKWFTAGYFQHAKMSWDNCCPQLDEGIDTKLWVWNGAGDMYCDLLTNLEWMTAIMPTNFVPSYNPYHLPTMGYRIPTMQHRPLTMGYPPADYGIPVPPPSPNYPKMLPLPTPSTKGNEKEKNGHNIEGLLMDLAEDGSEDGMSTPTEKDAGTIPPAATEIYASTIPPEPTSKVAGRTPPAATSKDASRTPPAPTGKEAGTTPE